jgi:hypothetical protein
MFVHLLKTDRMIVDRQTCTVRYYEMLTFRGTRRFSSEIELPSADCVILDDDSMAYLESQVQRVVAATVYSRMLARGETRV